MHDEPTKSGRLPSGDETLAGDPDRTAGSSLLASDLPRGASLGRYLILDRIGAGGMGTVYAAFDPELDRKVAIKLLHVDHDDGSRADRRRARLMREAQAMARLAHPNVVAVHDVGRLGDDVFVAMEFVEGTTLGGWIGQRPRDWRAILNVFLQAGRGLAAAHDKGLVHRDFKPDNVLVGLDGRARVTDFGLARAAADEDERPPGRVPAGMPGEDSSGSLDRLGTRLTVTGALLGTPAYMSPEQFLGQAIEARSDQFSFCVALIEALCGRRPFAGDTAAALAMNVIRGIMSELPRNVDAPGRVLEVVRRGLGPRPEDRWPEMTVLLDALERARAPRSRWLLPMVGTTAAVGVVVLGFAFRPADQDPCPEDAARLTGVWDDARQQELAQAFASLGPAYARDTATSVVASLDEYSGAWTEQRLDACRATRVRAEQSAELLDLRMACLQRRKHDLDALVSRLMAADEAVARHAARAVQRLPALDTCADGEELRRPIPLPDDPKARESIEELERQLAEVRAAVSTGQYPEARDLAERAFAAAEKLDYLPLSADAGFELGVARWLSDAPGQGVTSLERAYHDAVAGHHDSRAAESASELVHVLGGTLDQPEAALGWAAHARSMLRRLGRDPDRDSRLTNALGIVYERRGEYEQALRLYETSAAARVQRFGRMDIGVANALNNVALVLEIQSRWDEALEKHREAMEIRIEVAGPSHPDVADSHNNIALVYQGMGKYELGREHYEKALAIYESSVGPETLSAASALNNLGSVLHQLGQTEAAVEKLERGLAIREAQLPDDHPLIASSLKNLGTAYTDLQRPEDARRALRRALDIQHARLGEDHPYGAETLIYLGVLDRQTGRPTEALERYRRARSILEKAFPQGHAMTAQVMLESSRTLRDAGHLAESHRTLVEALELAESTAGKDHQLTNEIREALRPSKQGEARGD